LAASGIIGKCIEQSINNFLNKRILVDQPAYCMIATINVKTNLNVYYTVFSHSHEQDMSQFSTSRLANHFKHFCCLLFLEDAVGSFLVMSRSHLFWLWLSLLKVPLSKDWRKETLYCKIRNVQILAIAHLAFPYHWWLGAPKPTHDHGIDSLSAYKGYYFRQAIR